MTERVLLLHRRLAILMAGAGLVAFVGGAGPDTISPLFAGAALVAGFLRPPSSELSSRLEKFWLPFVFILLIRAIYRVLLMEGDVITPVVDLLLLLLAVEALRSLDSRNDIRLYTISFALLLASTIYRPSVVFALAFVVFVGSATFALLVRNLRAQTARHRAEPIPIPRSFIGGAALITLVTLTSSVLLFLVFPRMSQGWTGIENSSPLNLAGFSDQISLGSHGSRIQSNPRIVLRASFPDGRPALERLYWRGRAYDHFDGIRWTRSPDLGRSWAPPEWLQGREGESVRQRIFASDTGTGVLFGLHPIATIGAPSLRGTLVPDVAGDYSDWGRHLPVYDVVSRPGTPSPSTLRAATSGGIPSPTHYLQLPAITEQTRALADSISRSADSRYDRARAVERWFHQNFRYTLDLPRTAAEASLDHFLFERRAGHCEYFSTGMVVLLRAMGIPAREVNGFLGGEWNDFGQYVAVTENQAHAWVEVWFPRVGWVIFDPTPPGSIENAATSARSWPGRHVLDGLQYRWDRWVLEYGFAHQAKIVDRSMASLERLRSQGERLHLLFSPAALATWVLLLAAILGGVVIHRMRSAPPPEVRSYLQLRGVYRRAGMGGAAALPPLAFLDHLREGGSPGVVHAERVIGLYLKARFSLEDIGEDGLQEMRSALRSARIAVGWESPYLLDRIRSRGAGSGR